MSLHINNDLDEDSDTIAKHVAKCRDKRHIPEDSKLHIILQIRELSPLLGKEENLIGFNKLVNIPIDLKDEFVATIVKQLKTFFAD